MPKLRRVKVESLIGTQDTYIACPCGRILHPLWGSLYKIACHKCQRQFERGRDGWYCIEKSEEEGLLKQALNHINDLLSLLKTPYHGGYFCGACNIDEAAPCKPDCVVGLAEKFYDEVIKEQE